MKADTSFLKPSSSFKRKTYRMIAGIVLFILLYIATLIVGLICLFAGSIAAYALLSFYANWITILLSVGLFGLGIVFFFYTIKFVFGTVEEEESIEIEIKEKDHPQLFAFVGSVAREVGARRPKKIFLVPDVNASVTYSSSFWSLFLPVRKNLRIGLGLVNVLNIGEFKATIAHEFGHFSQRSMKTGSYVYMMNRVMFELVYRRDEFQDELQQWANSASFWPAVVGLFADLTNAFVGGFKRMFIAAYGKLNATYMELSKEMEFHADLVAVSVAGNEAMINTLRKIEFAAEAWHDTTAYTHMLGTSKNKKVCDLYNYHTKVMTSNATFINIEMRNSMPVIGANHVRQVEKPRLVLRDLWASHPSFEERQANMNRVSILSPVLGESAWSLFSNPSITAQAMTSLLYETGVAYNDFPVASDGDLEDFLKRNNQHEPVISKTFYGLYDHRLPPVFDIKKLVGKSTNKTFEQIINPAAGVLIKRHEVNKADLETIIMMHQNVMHADFFEYDGVRYFSKDVRKVRTMIQEQVSDDEKKIATIHEELTVYFFQRAKETGVEKLFLKLNQEMIDRRRDLDMANDFFARAGAMLTQLDTKKRWREDQITALCRNVARLEKEVKAFMRQLPEDMIRKNFPDPENVFQYVGTDMLWNESETKYNPDGFKHLFHYISQVVDTMAEGEWLATKAVYEQKLALTPPEFVKADQVLE